MRDRDGARGQIIGSEQCDARDSDGAEVDGEPVPFTNRNSHTDGVVSVPMMLVWQPDLQTVGKIGMRVGGVRVSVLIDVMVSLIAGVLMKPSVRQRGRWRRKAGDDRKNKRNTPHTEGTSHG